MWEFAEVAGPNAGQRRDDGFMYGTANRIDSLRIEGWKDWPHSRLRE